jgi:type II secretory pathway component PulF
MGSQIIFYKHRGVFFQFPIIDFFDKKVKFTHTDSLDFLRSICEFLKGSNDFAYCLESTIACVDQKFAKTLKAALNKIKQGQSISKTLSDYGILPDFLIKIINVAEKNSKVLESFLVSKEMLEWKIKNRQKLISAMVYPIFTFSVFCGVFCFFSFSLVPDMIDLIISINPDYNLDNFFLNKIFNILINFFYILLGCSVFFSLIYYFAFDFFVKFLMKVPFLGVFLQNREICCQAFYINQSLKSGVTIVESINIAINSSSSFVGKILSKVRDDIIKGTPVNLAFQSAKYLPENAINIIKSGEKSSNLDQAFQSLYNIYNSKYTTFIDRFFSNLPVVFLITTGLMILLFVVLIFSPIYSII